MKARRGSVLDSSDSDSSTSSASEAAEDVPHPTDSWVACDRCSKWRRVPASLAETLSDDAPW